MIRPAPQQQEFALAPESGPRPPVDPRTLRVDRIPALAPDGEAFWRDVMVVALRVARARGMVHPSDVRIAAELEDVKPPHANWWGSLAARLKDSGWRQVLSVQRNPIASRNGAKEIYAYAPPEVVA